MRTKWTLISATICLLAISCMSQPEKFTEKRIIIASKQTVKIKELDMSITNNGCYPKWTNSEDKMAATEIFPKASCDIVIKIKDSTCHYYNSSSPLYIKNIKIVVDQTNPWDRKEDSIPQGGCRIIVTRLPDLSR